MLLLLLPWKRLKWEETKEIMTIVKFAQKQKSTIKMILETECLPTYLSYS